METQNSKEVIAPEESLENVIRVLMIEDDDYYFAFVRRLIIRCERTQFDLVRVSSLAEASQYLSWEAPDVILLDLSLPDSKGLITVSRLREITAEVPVIILTSSDDAQDGLASVRLGAQDYLVKHAIGNDSISRCICYAIERRKFEESALRLATISDFTAMLAHDLKVPLIGANNVFEALLAGRFGELPEDQVQVVNDLQKSNNNQLLLVQKLLDVYRYEVDTASLEFEDVDIKSLVEHCVQTYKQTHESSVPIRMKLRDDLPMVYGDREALSRLINNLLDNAMKFSDGTKPVTIDTDISGTKLSIRVHNVGCVIPREVQNNLFHKFWQGVPGKSYVAQTGVGLYLCQRIIALHHGRITCQSTSKDGTTLRVILPAKLSP
jgi:signal transduction histidine kinase